MNLHLPDRGTFRPAPTLGPDTVRTGSWAACVTRASRTLAKRRPPAPPTMRLGLGLGLAMLLLVGMASPSSRAASERPPVRLLKVLPHYLDREGRHTINPSLFDRDAYQFELRRDPSLRSGMRFDVLWRARPGKPMALDLKIELRGSKAPEQAPVILTARAFARGGFSQWTRVPLVGADYEALGELLAWRVTLWDRDRLLAEQTSFLW